MPTSTNPNRQSQCGCMGRITAAQSPKFVTPEKKKYPVPVNRLKAALSRRNSRVVEALDRMRVSTSQNSKPATRFTNVPPAETRRELKSLDHATVLRVPEGA